MSFTGNVKEELSKISNLARKNEVIYELIGYFISNNFIEEKNTFKYSTESEYNIDRYAKILRNANINDFKIDIQAKVYYITFKKKELQHEENKNLRDAINEFDKSDSIEIENLKSLLRGIFMGSGSINNPQNKYHLEINLKNKLYAHKILSLVETNKQVSIKLKNIENKIYIKDGEEISKFLAFIGATKAVLGFEDIRVQREMNNKVNRLVNCKAANLNKVINASVNQVEAIRKLKQAGIYNKLPKDLKEIAELRLEYPDMSLIELGKKLKVPIGKSGVNYRLKKIEKLADEIGEKTI